MFVKAFWELLRNVSIHDAINNKNTQDQVMMATGIKNLSGGDVLYLTSTQTQNSISYGSYSGRGPEAQNANFCLLKGLTALVGSGSTTPTYDDYRLSTDVTSSFTTTSTTVSFATNAAGKLEMTVTWVGTNSSASSITINEFGLKKTIYRSYTNSGYTEHIDSMEVLIAHELLDTPVVVPAGSGATITARIELS